MGPGAMEVWGWGIEEMGRPRAWPSVWPCPGGLCSLTIQSAHGVRRMMGITVGGQLEHSAGFPFLSVF